MNNHQQNGTASAHPSETRERIWELVRTNGHKLIQAIERLIVRFSLVGDKPFFDAHDFPWTYHLENNWETIRAELDEVLKDHDALPNFQDISRDQRTLTTDNKWKTYFLYGFGYKAEKNCARCPETTRIVEQVPGMKTAFFSILAPGKHIPPHRGPYKGVLRCHLALKVPEPKEQCRIRVHNQIRHWEEGECLVFDDTYQHEVWNDTDGQRVVLFMDVVRPFAQPVAFLNELIIRLVAMTPFVQDARKNQLAWQQRFEQIKAQETE